MNPKWYECDKCKDNIGIIGKWLFWGLLHKCKQPKPFIRPKALHLKIKTSISCEELEKITFGHSNVQLSKKKKK